MSPGITAFNSYSLPSYSSDQPVEQRETRVTITSSEHPQSSVVGGPRQGVLPPSVRVCVWNKHGAHAILSQPLQVPQLCLRPLCDIFLKLECVSVSKMLGPA